MLVTFGTTSLAHRVPRVSVRENERHLLTMTEILAR